MHVIFDATNPRRGGEQTMTKGQDRAEVIDIHALQERDTDLVSAAMRWASAIAAEHRARHRPGGAGAVLMDDAAHHLARGISPP
jgi:hypothetical protein